MAEFYQRYLAKTIDIGDRDLQMVLLLGRRPTQTLALIQYALWTEAARSSGQYFTGHEILDYLVGAENGLPSTLKPMEQPSVNLRYLALRRLLRTRSWTSVLRLPKAMLRPDGVALTHNALLRNYLRHSPSAVRNAYDIDFGLENLPVNDAFLKQIDTPELADQMIGVLTRDLPLSEDIKARLAGAMRPFLEESYRDAADLLGRLRLVKRLPRRIFTGTGNKRISRALGLEVMRRGGDVTRCDHGGSFLLVHTPEYMALNELSVSTRFIVPTPLAAKSSELLAGQQRAAPLSSCAIEGSRGDPGLDVGAAAFSRTPSTKRRRRVMYVPSIFYGLHQVSPPILPGSLYLHWQTRLIAMLKEMPLDLLYKPHPGGHMPPMHLNPAQDVKTIKVPFEQAVIGADVLVYDAPATTTLAVGLCTDRPIVLLNHGTMRFNESLRSEIAARCRFVECSYDSENLPSILREALQEAICDGPPTADPTYFRRLFLGEASA